MDFDETITISKIEHVTTKEARKAIEIEKFFFVLTAESTASGYQQYGDLY